MAETDTYNLVISSSFDNVQRIEPYLKELQHKVGFGDEDFARIMLSLSEATTNAIVHGNRQDPKKDVIISSTLEDDTLLISVKDEGQGFDPAALPDPLQEENLLNEGGRGVFLIQQYSDSVSFSEDGTKLTMKFELDLSLN